MTKVNGLAVSWHLLYYYGMPLANIFKQDEEVIVVPSVGSPSAENMSWYSSEYEGQLAVDVYQTKDSLVVRSTIAGVKPEDLEITLNDDVITIRGKRAAEAEVPKEDYFYQECYWGGFSRSIILPTEIMPEKVEAALKNGVLTVRLPKAKKSKSISVKVKEND